LNLPEVPEGGEYQLVARIDSSEDVAELDETNNEALSECFEIIE
jgi:subtilase family serine protease